MSESEVSEVKAEMKELTSVITELNLNSASLDKRMDLFIQESRSNQEAFKSYMTRNDGDIKRLSENVHALQIWKAEVKGNHEDIRDIKRVVVRWIAGGMIASTAGLVGVVIAVFKMGTGS